MGKSVLLVSHSLSLGGTDRVAVHLANGLVDHARVTLLSVLPPRVESGLDRMLSPAVALAQLARGTSGSRTRDLLRSLPRLVSHIRREKPSVIVATGNNNALFAALGSKLGASGAALHVKVTNPVIRPKDSRFKRAFRMRSFGLTFRLADRVLVLSEAERRVCAQQFPALAHKFVVVANPYVTSAMLDVAPTTNGARRSVLTIARLHKQKNLPLMLEAWSRVNCPDAVLDILGDGPDRAKLEAQVAALGLQNRVTFHGYCGDVTPFLARANQFVLSSDYEGLPAVVLEAMAAGVPVVSTDCFAAARELIGTAPGCTVVRNNDPQALADAITATLDGDACRTSLRDIASSYSIGAGQRSHAQALGFA